MRKHSISILISTTVALSACGGGNSNGQTLQSSTVRPTASAPQVTPTVPPIATQNYAPAIAHIEQYIRTQMSEQQIVGLSIALVDDQKLIWSQGFGYANASSKTAANADTLFRAGSISKLFIASSLMQLAAQGKLKIDQPLNNVLNDFHVQSRFTAANEADSQVTFARVLSHQSGLPSEYYSGLRSNTITLSQLPSTMSGTWLSSQPGSVFSYSNIGFELLGATVEKLAGKPFSEQISSSLTRPLGMSRSSFLTPNDSNIASAHRAGKAVGRQPEYDNGPEGGLWSSVNELARFARMVLNDGQLDGQRILPAGTIAAMRQPQFSQNPYYPDCKIGLAWFLAACSSEPIGDGIAVMQHAGSTVLFNSQLTVLPEHKLAVVVMINSDTGAEFATQLASFAARALVQTKTGKTITVPQLPAAKLAAPSALDLQTYPGVYVRPSDDINNPPWLISNEGDALMLHMGELSVPLQRDQDGWLRVPNIPAFAQLRLRLQTIAHEPILLVQFNGETQLLATQIKPVAIPAEWLAMLGTYSVNHPDLGDAMQQAELIENGGYLALQSDGQILRILTPINSQHAVVSGVGRGLGDDVERTVTGFKALGVNFVKVPQQQARKAQNL